MSSSTRNVETDNYLDTLLTYIETGQVIPIIGPELVTVDTESGEVPLVEHLAKIVADEFDVEGLPDKLTLSDVVGAYKRQNGYPEDIYTRIFTIMQQRQFPTPPALSKLAAIRHFQLFATTTFDSLLAQAIDEVRFQGHHRTLEIAFAGAGSADLEEGWRRSTAPIVYHLLGRASAATNYVVTDEDTLEFLYALSVPRTAERLFEELERNHLLVLGCGFPDWLSRFFIRLAKGKRLSEKRVSDLLADSHSGTDKNLAIFLSHFSYRTRVYSGTATEFVNQLYESWIRRFGNMADLQPTLEPAADSAGALPDDAVFISYARQDMPAAERLWAGLKNVADVWLDRTLEPGDDYAQLIKRRIRRCSLFIPVISRTSVARDRGFFIREWKLAIDRLNEIARGTPFIVPVIIDDTPENADGVPDEFWDFHVSRLPDGVVNDAFIQKVVRDVRRVRSANRVIA